MSVVVSPTSSMKFVVPSEDTATLDEAIAFLDSFHDAEVLAPSSSTSNSKTPSTGGKSESQHPTKPQGKKAKNPPGHSAREHQRKRKEIQDLRHQVLRLELLVKDLKVNCLIGEPKSKWHKAAITECQERQRSEEINRKLKSFFPHHKKIVGNLRRILKRSTVSLKNEIFIKGQVHARATNTAIIAELESNIEKLYLDWTAQISVVSPASTHSWMQTKHDHIRGTIIEMNSATSLPCTANSAANLAWKNLSAHHLCSKTSIHGYYKLYKSWVFEVSNSPDVKQVQAVQVLCRFDEISRVVIVKTCQMRVGCDTFRANCWIVIARSHSDPNGSIVQACEQLSRDHVGDTQIPSETEILMKKLSLKLRKDLQLFQDELLDETENWSSKPRYQ